MMKTMFDWMIGAKDIPAPLGALFRQVEGLEAGVRGLDLEVILG